MGGYFINYFNRFGRQWQVYVEAESDDRANADNVGRFYVRNNKGGRSAVYAHHGQIAARPRIHTAL